MISGTIIACLAALLAAIVVFPLVYYISFDDMLLGVLRILPALVVIGVAAGAMLWSTELAKSSVALLVIPSLAALAGLLLGLPFAGLVVYPIESDAGTLTILTGVNGIVLAIGVVTAALLTGVGVLLRRMTSQARR
jgi:hypothetical protein